MLLSEDICPFLMFLSLYYAQQRFSVSQVEHQDIVHKAEIESLYAAFGHIGPDLPVVSKHSFADSQKAGRS